MTTKAALLNPAFFARFSYPEFFTSFSKFPEFPDPPYKSQLSNFMWKWTMVV